MEGYIWRESFVWAPKGGESALYLSDKQSRWEDVFKAVRLELMGEVFETGSSWDSENTEAAEAARQAPCGRRAEGRGERDWRSKVGVHKSPQ